MHVAMIGLLALSANLYELAIEDHMPPGEEDWAVAIEEAQQYCAELNDSYSPGCTIRLACGKVYEFQSTADICTTTRIVGCGVGRGLGGNVLQIRDQTAIKTWSYQMGCPFEMEHGGHGTLSLEHVGVQNVGTSTTRVPYHGIEAHRTVFLSDVHVQGFVQGIRMSCDTSRWSNCNTSVLDGVWIRMSQHAPIYVQGNTSNASLFTAVSAQSNCRKAAYWEEVLRPTYCDAYPAEPICQHLCSNAMDHSFLGNTWIALHTAQATDVHVDPHRAYPSVSLAGKSQRTVLIGTYSESDQLNGFGAQESTIVGGRNGFVPGSHVIYGPYRPGGLILKNELDPVNITQLEMGASAGAGNWVAFRSPALSASHPLRFKSMPSVGAYEFDIGNIGWALRFQQATKLLWLPDYIRHYPDVPWCHSTEDHECP